jgi:exopolysaccharide biosynthesis polyprenyl glycosylphosphotransferase
VLDARKPTPLNSTYVEQESLPPPADFATADVPPILQRPARRREANLAFACLLMDAVMLLAASLLAFTAPPGDARADSVIWPLCFSLLVLLLSSARGAYEPRLRLRPLEETRGVLSVTAIAAMAIITTRVIVGDSEGVAPETVYYWLLATVLIGVGRVTLLHTEARARRRGEAGDATLIVGAGRMGHLTARRLLDEPELGLRPIGFLDADPLELEERESAAVPVLGGITDLGRVVSEEGVRRVVVTFSRERHDVLLDAVRRCRDLGVSVSILPRLFEVEGERATVEHLGSLPLVSITASNPRGFGFTIKYAVERLLAAAALVLVFPVFLVSALAIKLTMGGPVFFRQRRVGADGREFDMIKLRTMKGRPEEDEEADIDWALEQLARNGGEIDLVGERAPRIDLGGDRRTRLGRLLRRFSLDEMPQLINVVRGEMSLVGPRPERVRYVHSFEQSIYRYAERHRVKSGMTGWAQVSGLRGKTSLRDRVEWDNYYIENWSPWLDFKIIVMTIACVLRNKHEEEWQ